MTKAELEAKVKALKEALTKFAIGTGMMGSTECKLCHAARDRDIDMVPSAHRPTCVLFEPDPTAVGVRRGG